MHALRTLLASSVTCESVESLTKAAHPHPQSQSAYAIAQRPRPSSFSGNRRTHEDRTADLRRLWFRFQRFEMTADTADGLEKNRGMKSRISQTTRRDRLSTTLDRILRGEELIVEGRGKAIAVLIYPQRNSI